MSFFSKMFGGNESPVESSVDASRVEEVQANLGEFETLNKNVKQEKVTDSWAAKYGPKAATYLAIATSLGFLTAGAYNYQDMGTAGIPNAENVYPAIGMIVGTGGLIATYIGAKWREVMG